MNTKPNLGFWKLWNLSFGFFGVQIAYALQSSQVSRIFSTIGADPHAVLMAIAVAASCAYATPVGTPPNTLVLTPGNFSFMDYMKAGIPLIIVSFIVSLIVIPMVWPFFP